MTGEFEKPKIKYEGTRPWFSEQVPAIPQALIDSYNGFLQVTDSVESKSKLEFSGKMISQEELVDEMRRGTKIGLSWSETLLEGIYGDLSDDDRVRSRANAEFLVGKAVEFFEEAKKQKEIDVNLSVRGRSK